jgi:hypothetical protein
MLKFLIITSLIVYVLYKLGSFFFKAGAASEQLRHHQQKKTFDGNQGQKRKDSKPGEYIDYEDVK